MKRFGQSGDADEHLVLLVEELLADVEVAITAALRALWIAAPNGLPPMTYTTTQVAQAVPMPVEAVRRAIHAGELAAKRHGKQYVMTLTDVVDFALKRYQRALMERLIRVATGDLGGT